MRLIICLSESPHRFLMEMTGNPPCTSTVFHLKKKYLFDPLICCTLKRRCGFENPLDGLFAGRRVSFKSTMNLCTDQVRNLVKGTITFSLKLVSNGVSPQIRPSTPDPHCCRPITPTAFPCFLLDPHIKLFTIRVVFCLPAILSRYLSSCLSIRPSVWLAGLVE